MITAKTEKVWYVGDQRFTTREAAQLRELTVLLSEPLVEKITWEYVADRILERQSAVIDILTTTDTSRPKARKIHGGTKPRKAKGEVAEGGAA